MLAAFAISFTSSVTSPVCPLTERTGLAGTPTLLMVAMLPTVALASVRTVSVTSFTPDVPPNALPKMVSVSLTA